MSQSLESQLKELQERVRSIEDLVQRVTQACIAAPQPAPAKTTTQPPPKLPAQLANENTTKPTKLRHLIAELQDGMKRVNVTAQVMEKDTPKEVNTAQGPTQTCYVMIADESGRIKLSLWGEHVQQVNVTDNVIIQDGYVSSYKGELQLNVGKWGKLTVV